MPTSLCWLDYMTFGEQYEFSLKGRKCLQMQLVDQLTFMLLFHTWIATVRNIQRESMVQSGMQRAIKTKLNEKSKLYRISQKADIVTFPIFWKGECSAATLLVICIWHYVKFQFTINNWEKTIERKKREWDWVVIGNIGVESGRLFWTISVSRGLTCSFIFAGSYCCSLQNPLFLLWWKTSLLFFLT